MRTWATALAILLTAGCKKAAPTVAPARAVAPQQTAKLCDSEFTEPLRGEVHLTRECSPYLVADSRILAINGVDLIIEPGVEIRMGSDARMEIGTTQRARLVVQGTSRDPVRFVSAGRKEPGFWRQLVLQDLAEGSRIEHLTLEHAGREEAPAVVVDAEQVSVRHLRVIHSKGPALTQSETGRGELTELRASDFSTAGGPEVLLKLNTRSVSGLGGDNRFPPGAVIQLFGHFDRDVKVPNPGVPYRYEGMLSIDGKEGHHANVVFSPGVTVQFYEGSGIRVGSTYPASLSALGRRGAPVVFTRFGQSALPGSWRGITFGEHAHAPTLRFLRMELAGSEREAALTYSRESTLGEITDSTVLGALGPAISVAPRSKPFVDFSRNTFQSIGGAVISAPLVALDKLGDGNRYPADARFETGGIVDSDTHLTAQDATYDLNESVKVEAAGETTRARLSAAPGVRIRVSPNARITVGGRHSGALTLEGKPDAPVVFAPIGDEPWRGIEIETRGAITAHHAILEGVDRDLAALRFHRDARGRLEDVRFERVSTGVSACLNRVSIHDLEAAPGTRLVDRERC